MLIHYNRERCDHLDLLISLLASAIILYHERMEIAAVSAIVASGFSKNNDTSRRSCKRRQQG